MADHVFTELSTFTVIVTCLLVSTTRAQSCGGTLNSTAGDITSPDFPSQPEANITCVWYIVKTDRYAFLHLEQLELMGAEASLQIYSGNVTAGSSELVGNFTEDSEVRQVITSDNVTTVILFTGEWPIDNKTARFNLHYKTAPVCQADLSAWSLQLKSPLCSSGALPLKCSYNIKKQNSNSSLTLSFQKFNMQGGKVTVKQNNQTLADLSGTKIPEDVFTKGDNLVLEYWTNTSQTSEFTAMVNSINQGCLFNITLTDWGIPVPLKRPSNAQSSVRCQWVIQVPDNGTVRISTDQNSVMSSHLMVSDGWSLFGSERRVILGLPQSGTSYVSSDKTVSVYLSSDPSLITGEIVLTATPQMYGGVFHTSGSLEGHGVNVDGSSQWYYYLINPDQQRIRLLMTNSSLFPASSIKCYDGLTESCPLLADFRSDRPFYPVVSSGSQMLVVASNLEYRGFFTAEFSPDIDGCDQISEGRQGQYRGSVTPKGSEVKVCTWIIKPVMEEGVFLIKLSMSGFDRADNLTLYDGLSEYNFNVLLARGEKSRRTQTIPVVVVPATTGARLSYSTNAMNQTVTRSVKGEYFFTSDKLCGGSLPQNKSGNIMSLSFPNERYPLNVHCDWNTSVSLGKLLYLTFETFDLDPGHSVKVFPYVNETEVNNSGYVFNGSSVPSDILIPGPHIKITFTTEKFHQGGNSGRGFNISYRTIEDGGELTRRKGEISTPDFPTSVSSSMECIWIIEVPAKGDNSSSVPIISMDFDLESFSQMSEKNLLEFRDGNSQHAPLSEVKLANGKTKGVYSRTNQLWIRYLYTLHNSTGNAPGFAFKMRYNTYDCPKSQQCDNGVCMQTGWKCDGVDQCGDESDEKNCSNTVTTKTGVAGFVVALLVLMGFAVGVIVALVAPSVYKRLRYPHYRHLRDVVSPIET